MSVTDNIFTALVPEEPGYPPASVAEALLSVGQRVEGNFCEEGDWYAGCIAAVHHPESGTAAATYDIEFDDGDEEEDVARCMIRLAGDAPAGDADGHGCGSDDGAENLDPLRDGSREGMRAWRTKYEEAVFEQDCRDSGLPTPTEASATEVARIPGFLSLDEIAELRTALAAAQAGHDINSVEKGPDGGLLEEDGVDGVWRTSFLHTRGFWRDRLPQFRDKLRRAMETIDEAHWTVLRGRDAADIHFRTVEVHEYSPGGCLSQPKHYDGGSLITMDIMLALPGVDFEGGAFVAPLVDEAGELEGGVARPEFNQGDAVFFLSHKVR
jgi:hypothetical protein